MSERPGFGARTYSQIRGTRPVRWAAGLLPAPTRRALRRTLGRPTPPKRPSKHAGPAPAPAVHRPFVPDGTGADPRVNVIGQLRTESGMAEVGRSLVVSAWAAGVRVAPISASDRDGRGPDTRLAHAIGVEAPHPVNVFCINASATVHVMDKFGPAVTAGRYNIGFWFWELGRFPDVWQDALDRVDEVWVASECVRDVISARTSKPVCTMRLAIDATPSRPYGRDEFGLPDDVYAFLLVFDFTSHAARKNPLGTVAAFRAAFPCGDEPVVLVLKSTNADLAPEAVRRIHEAIDGDERIRLVDGSMGRDAVFGLESVVDCFVSLHRSEGFGLGLAESMYLGKPVIATAYSGNMEFMDESTALLVDYRLVPVLEGEYPHAEGQQWAEPDVDQAAALMRRLFEDPDLGREVGARARAHMLEDFSARAAGSRMAERLRQILDGEA